jgi:hypothetical protein
VLANLLSSPFAHPRLTLATATWATLSTVSLPPVSAAPLPRARTVVFRSPPHWHFRGIVTRSRDFAPVCDTESSCCASGGF